MGEISKLTEKTAEVRSSDNKRIGVVGAILGNEILMTVSSHFVDRSGRFILPKKMIDKIKRKKIYLALSETEFKEWWEEEGLMLEAEYLEGIKKEIRKAFDSNLAGEQVSILLKNNSCPYCGSFVAGKELLLCHYCGLYLLEDEAGDYKVPDKQRAKICLEQEKIILSLPSEVRFTLHSDEWVHYSIEIKPEEDGLLVTSKNLIRFKWKGKKKDREDNWIIPFERIISVSLAQDHKHYAGFGPGYSIAGVKEPSITLRVKYQTEKKYIADKGWEEKKVVIPGDRYSPGKIEVIKRYVQKLKEMRRIILGEFVPVSDY